MRTFCFSARRACHRTSPIRLNVHRCLSRFDSSAVQGYFRTP